VDLSSRGFLGREEKNLPGVRLVVVQVANPDEACEFYKSQFDLEVLGRDSDGAVRLSDGTVTLLLTKEQIRPKNGIQYFGIQVNGLSAVKKNLQDGGIEVFPVEGTSGQIQFSDPEGNRVVVSESGWAAR
jgi:predicted enzyme related to lactoylglutathione lyase